MRKAMTLSFELMTLPPAPQARHRADWTTRSKNMMRPTGELVAWVRIPTLSMVSDTVIYIYYGNTDVATPTENINAVWDTDYVGVWHLDESPANGVAGHDDSTGNPNDGTPQLFGGVAGSTTDATGKIGGADEFDGVDDYVDLGNLQSLAGSSGLTTSFWFNAQTLPSVTGDNDGLVIQHDTFDEQFGCRFAGATSALNCYVETGAVVANVSIAYSGNIVVTNLTCPHERVHPLS